MNEYQTCEGPPPNPILGDTHEFVISAILQGTLFIFVSQIIQNYFLQHIAQPRIVSQLLAGILLGPTIWPPRGAFIKFLFPKDISMYLSLVGDVARVLFIFLVGLELDIAHMMQTKRVAGAIALGGIASCLFLGGSVSYVFYKATDTTGSMLFFCLLFSALLSSTSSPVLVEMCSRLKLATSDIGHLAVSTALLNDLASLLLLSIMTSKSGSRYELDDYFTELGLLLFIVTILVIFFRVSIQMMNRMYPKRKTLRRMETLGIMTFVVGIVWIVKKSHYSPMVGSFFVGVFFPKDGKICKLLVQQLIVIVHELVFPIYFGYVGASTDAKVIGKDWSMVWLLFGIAGLSTLGKMAGTIAVTSYYDMTLVEGIVLGLLLNVKAHLNIMFLAIFSRRQIWSNEYHMMLLIPTLLCTVVAGPLVGWILGAKQRRVSLQSKAGLEDALPDAQLHILSCVYTPRHILAMLNLIEASRWGEGALSPSVMHLVQLTGKLATSTLLYHQGLENEEEEKDEDSKHIGDVVDSFSSKTGLCVAQHQACATFERMHKDVRKIAERGFPSVVVVPFHKHLRVDGRMEVTNDGYRIANNKILQHAHCTVVVLLDRGFGGLVYSSDTDPFGVSVLVVFLGGADDREAAAFAGRLAYHPGMSIVLMRFLPVIAKEDVRVKGASAPACNKDQVAAVIMSIPEQAEDDRDKDQHFLSNFCERYVASGLVGYIEKRVHGGTEIATTLRSMKGEYTLFVVGRGKHDIIRSSTMTAGLRDFEDYSDLGPIGGLLASPEFIGHGSVLVVQQYCEGSADQNHQKK